MTADRPEAPRGRVAEIRARLAAITPGPWRWGYLDNSDEGRNLVTEQEYVLDWPEEKPFTLPKRILQRSLGEGENEEADAEFIAHAPEDVAYLLEIAARAEALIVALGDPYQNDPEEARERLARLLGWESY